MNQYLSVSVVNEQIKNLLESTFSRVMIEGELSRITYHNSGHIYFTLKDANSSIKCVMFRSYAQKLRFRLEEGQSVMLDGALTLYKPRGEYQVNAIKIEPSGTGALALAYEQLKKDLEKKGYFKKEIKKDIPSYPQNIALVTSATGAALQDMLRVATTRYQNIKFDIYDVLVQGEMASSQIANAINIADQRSYDIIVIARGGGSIEDLWAFNEKIVADAIFNATTPIVSAVGHEIDFLISDFVADLRAPTPSAAIQMILPDKNELLMNIDNIRNSFNQILEHKINKSKLLIDDLSVRFKENSIEQKISFALSEIDSLKKRYNQLIEHKIEFKSREIPHLAENFSRFISQSFLDKHRELNSLTQVFNQANPKNKQMKGLAQVVKSSKVISLDSLNKDDEFELQDTRYKILSKVIAKKVL